MVIQIIYKKILEQKILEQKIKETYIMVDKYLKHLQEAVHDVGSRSPLFSKLTRNAENIRKKTKLQAYKTLGCAKFEGKAINVNITKNQKNRAKQYTICNTKAEIAGLQAQIKLIQSIASKCGNDTACRNNVKIAIQNLNNRIKAKK